MKYAKIFKQNCTVEEAVLLIEQESGEEADALYYAFADSMKNSGKKSPPAVRPPGREFPIPGGTAFEVDLSDLPRTVHSSIYDVWVAYSEIKEFPPALKERLEKLIACTHRV